MGSLDVALRKAVKQGNLSKALNLLEEGVSPNYKPLYRYPPPLQIAFEQQDVAMFRLLLSAGAFIHAEMIEAIFRPPYEQYVVDLVKHILAYWPNFDEVIYVIFKTLIEYYQGPSARKVLELLIDYGRPLYDEDWALHHCIACQRNDLIPMLIDRGANICDQFSWNGNNALSLAVKYNNVEAVKILMKNGATIFEYNSGSTALHQACRKHPAIVQVMIKFGVNLNALDGASRPALEVASPEIKEVLIKQLAKLMFEGHHVCRENLDCLEREGEDSEYFALCLKELANMKRTRLFKSITYYDLFEMKNQHRLIRLTKNEHFTNAFFLSEVRDTLKIYVQDLNAIVFDSIKKRDLLKSEEKKLNSIFKGFLPQLVIAKISYMSVADSFDSD